MKQQGFIDPFTLGFIIVGVIALLGASGCAFDKSSTAENSMDMGLDYSVDANGCLVPKNIKVTCGRDEGDEVGGSVDKAVVK
jgi:hypothetical protein